MRIDARGIVREVGAGFWPGNTILRGEGHRYYAAAPDGSTSLKSVVQGSAEWRMGGVRRVIPAGSHMVVNAGPYEVEIDAPARVTVTLCTFFSGGYLADLAQNLAGPAGELLDAGADARELEWSEAVEPADEGVLPLIRRLDDALRHDRDPEPAFERLATELVLRRIRDRRRVDALPTVRAATRAEVYRRVLRGRDFMLSSLDTAVDLHAAARAAAMSPFHFHRSFRALFGEPPHRFLTNARLDRAAHLLTATALSATEIALASGFESVPSFTTAFRRRFGVTPGQYRKSKQR